MYTEIAADIFDLICTRFKHSIYNVIFVTFIIYRFHAVLKSPSDQLTQNALKIDYKSLKFPVGNHVGGAKHKRYRTSLVGQEQVQI